MIRGWPGLDGAGMQSQQQENLTGRIGRWSAQHRKKAILGWLAFVVASMVIGFGVIPQEKIDNKTAGGPGAHAASSTG